MREDFLGLCVVLLICFVLVVRMVIVCAWSEVHVTGTSKLEKMQEGHPKMIYTNTDMHGGNS